MATCSQCGISIPKEQKVCSMCYGDISYGTDGYYQQWAEEQERINEENKQREREDTL